MKKMRIPPETGTREPKSASTAFQHRKLHQTAPSTAAMERPAARRDSRPA